MSDKDLIGLWAYAAEFKPALGGELKIARDGGVWHASIGGAETSFAVDVDKVRFSFAEGGGFRGELGDGGKAIEGFWLQPSGETEDRRDPGGSGQSFASPVVFERSGENEWRGEVVPLKDHFTLYLKIFRNDEGALLGAFRNPELNSNGGASRFLVERDSAAVRFGLPSEDFGFDVRHKAQLLSTPARLKIHWPDLGSDIVLERHAPEEAPAFFPRPPDEPAYVYKQPEGTGDGWRTARARDVGLDEGAIEQAVQKIIDGDPAARRPALIHSMLVARRGKLVLEEYFFGHDRDTRHDLRSAGKTFASVMLGAAMREGVEIGPQSRVYDVLAAKGPFANPDPRKAKITLAHLMTHTAGFACDDNDDASPGNEGTMQTQTREPDWAKYALDLPMAHEPGERYAYCSANMNLAGAALAEATGTWLPALFDRTVARPLGFERYYWNLTPTGDGYLGGGAFVRPRDLLKLGQTYLDGGQWRGRRIVEEDWVALSTAGHQEISPATTGLTPEEFSNFYGAGVDGYAWHRYGVRVGERVYDEYEASGNGGQLLIVVPEFDLVIAFTGGNYMQGGIWSRWRNDIVGAAIIAGIEK